MFCSFLLCGLGFSLGFAVFGKSGQTGSLHTKCAGQESTTSLWELTQLSFFSFVQHHSFYCFHSCLCVRLFCHRYISTNGSVVFFDVSSHVQGRFLLHEVCNLICWVSFTAHACDENWCLRLACTAHKLKGTEKFSRRNFLQPTHDFLWRARESCRCFTQADTCTHAHTHTHAHTRTHVFSRAPCCPGPRILMSTKVHWTSHQIPPSSPQVWGTVISIQGTRSNCPGNSLEVL